MTTKRFPAFGKIMMALRYAGKTPSGECAYVVFDWNLACAFPRVIIPDGIAFENLEFRFLAGLDVVIAFREKDADRVFALAQAILQVNPHILNALNVDLPQSTVIKNLSGEVML